MNRLYTVLLSLLTTASLSFAQTEAITDGSFEDGTPNPSWNEASVNFGSPLCDMASCGNCGGPCGPKTGTWYAWFGGAGALEIGSLTQTINIPNGATGATLSFWVMTPVVFNHDLDTLQVQIDGDNLFELTNADSSTYQSAYVMETVDVSSYADGANHTLTLWGYEDGAGGAGVTNYLVDDISLTYTDPAAGITHDLLSEGLRIYPNPASDQLNIDVSLARTRDMRVALYATSGALVSMHTIEAGRTGTLHIPVAEFADGAYVLKLNDGSSVITKPVIVSR